MKNNYIVLAALFTCVSTTAVSAQATTSAMVDTGIKQLQRSTKPAKSGDAIALQANNTAAKSSSGTTAKPARVVQVPAITTQSASGSVSTRVANVAISADSGGKAAPPVVRSAKVVKVKPPGE